MRMDDILHFWQQGLNRTFPCPSEGVVVMIGITMAPHLASCVKGTFLLVLSTVYVTLPWLHHSVDFPCWFYRPAERLVSLIKNRIVIKYERTKQAPCTVQVTRKPK